MDDEHESNDAALASDGDADALQRLIVHCHEPLYAVVARSRAAGLAARVDPDDVLQQAYVAAFRTLCGGAENDRASSADAADDPGGRAPAGSGRPQFESTGHFYRWLEKVAVNQLRDVEQAMRRRKRDVAREVRLAASPSASYPDLVQRLAAPDRTPSQSVARAEAVAAVMSSLARLPDNQRDVIRWRFVEGVPFAEIALRLGKSDEAIYMICHRGLRALRGLLVSITHYLTKS